MLYANPFWDKSATQIGVSYKEYNSVKNSIEKAFLDFYSGVRPDGDRDPKYWYVLNSRGKNYPAKST